MHLHFFPGPVFAWAFLGVLLLLLAMAALIDLRHMVVPKSLTLTALPLGLALNLVRGSWLGGEGYNVWWLGAGGPLVGAADGLLFALAGFAVAFGMFFLMWILGVCGGGDVKLFAAVGSWVGAYLAFVVLCITILVVVCMVFFRLLGSLLTGEWQKASKTLGRPQSGRGGRAAPLTPRKRALGFSLPLAIATLLVLVWAFRVDLHVAPAPASPNVQVSHHDR